MGVTCFVIVFWLFILLAHSAVGENGRPDRDNTSQKYMQPIGLRAFGTWVLRGARCWCQRVWDLAPSALGCCAAHAVGASAYWDAAPLALECCAAHVVGASAFGNWRVARLGIGLRYLWLAPARFQGRQHW